MARPKGSKTREHVVAEEIPASCPACGSVDMAVVKGYSPRVVSFCGTRPNGVAYSRIEIRMKQCACGQFVAVKTFIPTKTNRVSLGDKLHAE